MDRAGADYSFPLNRRPAAELRHLGADREPLLIFDGVLRDPGSLIDYAAREVAFSPGCGPEGGYPGLKAPAPLNYVETLARALSGAIESAFGLRNVKLAEARCNFSLVTLPPDALLPLQRVPHVDTFDPLKFAILHYLCDPPFGGTAFYRHLATGYEALRPEIRGEFEAARDRELAGTPLGPGYIQGDTDHYRQIGVVEARMNRVIVYRSCLLHSGIIVPEAPLSDDPRRGRLTANIFIRYRQL